MLPGVLAASVLPPTCHLLPCTLRASHPQLPISFPAPQQALLLPPASPAPPDPPLYCAWLTAALTCLLLTQLKATSSRKPSASSLL